MKSLKLILVVIVIGAYSELWAQEILYSHSKDEVVNKSETDEFEQNEYKNSKLRYRINTGTSFAFSDFGNAMAIYAEPELAYRLRPKLNITAGFLFVNSNISGLYSDINHSNRNYTASYITAGIEYNASERLRISGEILYGMNKSPYSLGNKNGSSDYYLRFSAEYKLTKSISVGIQVIKENYNMSPFNTIFDGNRFGAY